MKVCAEPGCPALQQESRCIEHRSARERARGTRQARGYDADYERALRSPEFVAATTCVNCGQPFTRDNPKTGGHSVALRNAGRGSQILPHCRICNYGWSRTSL